MVKFWIFFKPTLICPGLGPAVFKGRVLSGLSEWLLNKWKRLKMLVRYGLDLTFFINSRLASWSLHAGSVIESGIWIGGILWIIFIVVFAWFASDLKFDWLRLTDLHSDGRVEGLLVTVLWSPVQVRRVGLIVVYLLFMYISLGSI